MKFLSRSDEVYRHQKLDPNVFGGVDLPGYSSLEGRTRSEGYRLQTGMAMGTTALIAGLQAANGVSTREVAISTGVALATVAGSVALTEKLIR